LVHATNLTKRYGRLTALHDVSFSIREGEILGLIGPNGSGKTTLFECLGGVLPLDGGMVLQGGRPLTASDRASSLFYLPDGIAPWPSQTVRWALEFTANFSNTLAGDVANTSQSRNTEFDTAWIYRFGAGKEGLKKVAGQFFIRYANRYSHSLERIFLNDNLSKNQTLTVNLSFTFF